MSRAWGKARFRQRFETAESRRFRRGISASQRTSIVRLSRRAGRLSMRAIAERVGVSHATVIAVLRREADRVA